MQRRRFLKQIAALGAAPILLNGVPVRVMANSMASQLTCSEVNERVLVVIQLHGANDGLNTAVPLNHYSTYSTIRPNISLPTTGLRPLITLDSTLPSNQQVGLNADMTAFKSLYDSGKLSLVQNAGYANNNRSHFKAKDDWLSGSDSLTQYNSGWMARFLDTQYPGYPSQYPNAFMQDPIGLELGSTAVSLSFHRNQGGSIGLAMKGDPSGFYSLVSSVGGPAPTTVPATHFGNKLQHVINVEASTNAYAQRIDNVYLNGSNAAGVTYPSTYHTAGGPKNNNELAPQLKTVARLISGGIKTKIFWVRLTGFDNHVNQTGSTDPTYGVHATLLYHLSEAVKAFQDDLAAQGLEDRVLTVTFSEFGRRATENGSVGTDHGTYAPMFVIGKHAKAGVLGTNPDLTNLAGNDLSTLEHDYRRIFTTVMQDWLGADSSAIASMNFSAFENQKLALIDTPEVVPVSCYLRPLPVSLVDFTAHAQPNDQVRCEWRTRVEVNNDKFIIERSQDGEVFEDLATLKGAGTSYQFNAYEWTDEDPFFGVSYYRLKQVDFDGQASYYPKVAVLLQPDHDEITYKAYPNPATEFFKIDINSVRAVPAHLSMANNQGQIVFEERMDIEKGKSTHTIQCGHLAEGMYIVTVVTGQGERIGFKLIKK